MPQSIKQHLELLGHTVRDRVTQFEGVVSSVSFDLYGCIQCVVTPASVDGHDLKDSRWFDIARLEQISTDRAMALPDYVSGYIAEGRKGPAEKPAGRL